jgi:hypothetical protein
VWEGLLDNRKRLQRTKKHEETASTSTEDKPMRLLQDMNQFEADHQLFLKDLGMKHTD